MQVIPGHKMLPDGRFVPLTESEQAFVRMHTPPTLEEALSEVPMAREAIAGLAAPPDTASRCHSDMSPRGMAARNLVVAEAAHAGAAREEAARVVPAVPAPDDPRSFTELMDRGTAFLTKFAETKPAIYETLRREHFARYSR